METLSVTLFVIVGLAVTLGANYMAYKAGHRSGYEMAQSREKNRRALDVANARLAGRLEAWREIDDMVERMARHEVTDDRQVH